MCVSGKLIQPKQFEPQSLINNQILKVIKDFLKLIHDFGSLQASLQVPLHNVFQIYPLRAQSPGRKQSRLKRGLKNKKFIISSFLVIQRF